MTDLPCTIMTGAVSLVDMPKPEHISVCPCGYDNKFTTDTICSYCGESIKFQDVDEIKLITNILERSGFRIQGIKTIPYNTRVTLIDIYLKPDKKLIGYLLL